MSWSDNSARSLSQLSFPSEQEGELTISKDCRSKRSLDGGGLGEGLLDDDCVTDEEEKPGASESVKMAPSPLATILTNGRF